METFQESGLDERIIRAIDDLGFVKPSPIQAQTIPFLLDSSQDLVALAQTGTGKTAAFGLPLLQKTDIDSKKIQGLVLCPTRELCMQITNDLDEFAKYMDGLFVIPVYGGASIEKQIGALQRGGQVVVGTPGRVLDLIKRKKLKLDKLNCLVLDEADEMLNMGFKDDLEAIMAQMPEQRQSMLFSATMPKGIASIAKKFMNDAAQLSAGKANTGAENVQHHYYVVQASNRYPALKRIVDYYPSIYGIVFCRTRRETKEVADHLMKDGYNADALHGDLSQAQRDVVMKRFRQKQLQVLVATDVAARGLDVNELTHIINYNIPDELEAYIHRSGRTGRAGKHGISILLTHSREKSKIAQLEKKVGKEFQHKLVPTGNEVCEKQLFNLIDKVEWVDIDEDMIKPYLGIIEKKLAWLSREDLIKRFVSVEFNRFLTYYKDAADLNVAEARDTGRKEKKNKKRKDRQNSDDDPRLKQQNSNFARFHINLGSKHRFSKIDLISLINKQTGNKHIEIGKIEILYAYSFFEIPVMLKEEVLAAFEGVQRDGIPIKLDVSKQKRKSKGSKRPMGKKSSSKKRRKK